MTYEFLNFPTNDLSEAEVRQEITKALKFWSDVTPLTFTEIKTATGISPADIRIGFYSEAHLKDYRPFDGPRGELAHAFLPFSYGKKRLDREIGYGDVHFDDDERWSLTYKG